MVQKINLYDAQVALEHTYAKNQLTSRVRSYFEPLKSDIEPKAKQIDLPVDFCIDFLVQLSIRKRCDIPTIVGVLRYHFDDSQETVNAITKCIYLGLCLFDQQTQILIVKAEIPSEMQFEIDKFQYALPFVIKPKKLVSNKTSGFYTDPLKKQSLLLRNNHHDDDICLDHLNKVNGYKLKLNLNVVEMIQNKWKNLDKRKDGETTVEFLARKKAFEKYDRTSRDVIKLLTSISDHFYLRHAADKRGRIYSCGYHVNYQGNDWNKAVIEFAEEEYLNES